MRETVGKLLSVVNWKKFPQVIEVTVDVLRKLYAETSTDILPKCF